eukprot:3666160-Amphidinium_carterae.1
MQNKIKSSNDWKSWAWCGTPTCVNFARFPWPKSECRYAGISPAGGILRSIVENAHAHARANRHTDKHTDTDTQTDTRTQTQTRTQSLGEATYTR